MKKTLVIVALIAWGFAFASCQNRAPTAPGQTSELQPVVPSNFARVSDENFLYVSRHLVTQGEWIAVMGANSGDRFRPDPGMPPETDRMSLPAEMVSWYDALVFANMLSMATAGLTLAYELPDVWPNPASWSSDPADWGDAPASPSRCDRWDAARIVAGSNGYRLPTDAQWESAARAGGFALSESDATENAGTQEAGRQRPSLLYDNVGEWVWDWYGADGRVVRTWDRFATDAEAQIARRGRLHPSARGLNLGFRLVRP